MRLLRLAGPTTLLMALAVSAAQGQQGPPPTPKPGPEHAVLKMDVGTWDAVMEMKGPDGKPVKSKGVEVNKMGCGGLCLITDFKGDVMGSAFVGHGVTAWDPSKKKYVGSWTDSMTLGILIGETTWDAAAKKGTGWMEGPDMTGKVTKMQSVVEHKGNTRVMTVSGPGPDGKEGEQFKITYTRRKG